MKLPLTIVILSVIAALALSSPAVPLRGTLKDITEGEQSGMRMAATTDGDEATQKAEGSSEQSGNHAAQGSGVAGSGSQDNAAQGSGGAVIVDVSKCGAGGFTIWVTSNQKVHVTTIPCGAGATAIYTKVGNGEKTGPKYMAGQVTSVDDQGSNDLKFNGNEKLLWSLLSESTTFTTPAPAAAARILLRFLDSSSVSYEFPLNNGRKIEVETKSGEATYTLMDGNTKIYSGSTDSAGDKFTVDSDGQLLDPKKNVILKDAVSFAPSIKAIIPSLVAVLAMVFMI